MVEITSLGLHITDCCNANCLHCAFFCGPEIKGCMNFKEAKKYVTDAKALNTEIICITGGEPMLYPVLVKRIIAECSHLSFPQIWLFTNGFWAHNKSKANATVQELKNVGLTKMFFSVDFFHQEYVPIKSVKNAVEASLESSLEVSIDARFVGKPGEQNKFNFATQRHLEFLNNLTTKVEVTKTQSMFVGRAAESLIKHVKMKPLSEILTETCSGAWAGGTLKSPLGVDVDEFGFVTICPGLSIGNAREVSLRKIVENYNYQDYMVIAVLCDEGLKGLTELASKYGFVPNRAYVDGCHLCYETRKFIRKHFPEAFCYSDKILTK
ncbi:MAG: radical SAM protein [Candidatus Bathyarchaeia archaeon]